MSSSLRLPVRRVMLSTSFRPLTSTPRRFYPGSKEPSGDYGSGTGDPRGEKPLEQGPNPSADKEHPGPPPPEVGHGSGTGTKADKQQQGGHEQPSGQGQQKRQFSTLRQLLSPSSRPKSTEGLEPKILNEEPPSKSEQSEDVKKHNEELDQRAEKAHESSGDEEKVDKDFWKGHGGRDRTA